MEKLIDLFLKKLKTSESNTMDSFSPSNQFIIMRSILLYPQLLEEYGEPYGTLKNLPKELKTTILDLRLTFLEQFKKAANAYEESDNITGIEVNEIALIALNKNNFQEIYDTYPISLKNSFESHIKNISENQHKDFEYRYGAEALEAVLELKKIINA